MFLILTFLIVFSFGLYRYIKDQERMATHQLLYYILQNMERGDTNAINDFLQAIKNSGCSIEEYVSALPLSYEAQARMRNLLRSALDEKAENSKQKSDLEKENRIVPFN